MPFQFAITELPDLHCVELLLFSLTENTTRQLYVDFKDLISFAEREEAQPFGDHGELETFFKKHNAIHPSHGY